MVISTGFVPIPDQTGTSLEHSKAYLRPHGPKRQGKKRGGGGRVGG